MTMVQRIQLFSKQFGWLYRLHHEDERCLACQEKENKTAIASLS
jgi:hypothetical protein